MSEVFSMDWWLLTILAALIGGWAFIIANRFLVTTPFSWLKKRRKNRKREYIIFISELTTNQNMFQLMGVEINIRLFGVLACLIIGATIFLFPEIRDYPFASFQGKTIPFVVLPIFFLFAISVRPYSEANYIKKNLQRAIALDYARKKLPTNFVKALEKHEIKALQLSHEQLETATDEQIKVLYSLLGCDIRSRLSNLIRFKLKIRRWD